MDRIILEFHLLSEQDPEECFLVKTLNTRNMQYSVPAGLFDQLLNAMNDDSEEEEQAVAGPSSGAGGNEQSRKLQHDDLD